MYEALLVVHILSGFAWVGGAFVLVLGLRNIRAAEGHEPADRMIGLMEKTTTWVFAVAPVLVLATGIAQVAINDAWAFSDLWIILAISLFVVNAILGGGVGGRFEKQMKEARENGRLVPAVFDRFLILTWVEMVILVAIVALMVYKPI